MRSRSPQASCLRLCSQHTLHTRFCSLCSFRACDSVRSTPFTRDSVRCEVLVLAILFASHPSQAFLFAVKVSCSRSCPQPIIHPSLCLLLSIRWRCSPQACNPSHFVCGSAPPPTSVTSCTAAPPRNSVVRWLHSCLPRYAFPFPSAHFRISKMKRKGT